MGLKLGVFVGKKLPGNITWSKTAIRITGIYRGSSNAVQLNWDLKLEKASAFSVRWWARNLSPLGKVLVLNSLFFPLF